jgi:ribosomal protein RSM22 (predicted rRNA methylase)
LNYEDEKFSYLIFSKEPKVQSFSSRLLRHPQIFKGHLKLSLCQQNGQIKEQVVSKKDNNFYKLSRKLDWGDCF